MSIREQGIQRVLVANRGEIARRLIRAARELGMEACAIASDPDADAPWHREASRIVRLPGSTAAETYLDGEKVIAAAHAMEADAIHPGYGFLSENADFAAACAEAGIVFVGPRPDAMRALGSKINALEIARQAGVPTVPGESGEGKDDEAMAEAAERIGFPLLVKASAGGGGRGMRRVDAAAEFPDALAAARAEAASAFGDDRVLLERYFERARHVEVQVLGDEHGQLRHLFERECSIQRRYQKVIEEAPSPGVSPSLRKRMTDAALALAAAVGYTSAGTVEFLVTGDEFFFLEMNTRLQVEHPVTEAITGLDLAAWQLRIAAGEAIDFSQESLGIRGHAIECRLYAEDPESGFLPSIGRIAHYRAPGGPGIRCDDGVASGSEITPHYDAMIAKIITEGSDRDAAIRRMQVALSDTEILGLKTNREYLMAILDTPEFRAGDTHTRFLDENFSTSSAGTTQGSRESDWLIAAAFESVIAGASGRRGNEDGDGTGPAPDPWTLAGAWRNVRLAAQRGGSES